LTWHIDKGPGTTHVAVHGRPDGISVSALHAELKHLCGLQPNCLTIDLSGMPAADHALLTGSALPARCNSMTSGTAVLVCGAKPADAVVGVGNHGLRARMTRHLARACEALTVQPLCSPSFAELALPMSGAARRTRDLVTQACLTWDLPHLTGAAALIANELVSYSIRHASTVMTVVTLLHHDILYLAVRAGSRLDPTPQHRDPATSLELLIINSLADHWGFLTDDDDVVIWAALPVHPTAT
jgi:hypothetical protein